MARKKEDKKFIIIKGAKEHNLKNVNLKIPRDEFVVFTGLSGSGKSSLAFDTIYAEGQRRYMESLSSYARQFLGRMEKANVESIEGLSPAISIDQKSTNRNPRSTVGTVTEIYDHFRLLYARIGTVHCPNCGKEISKQTVDQMVDSIMKLEESTKIMILAPVVRGKKGRHEKVLESAVKSGFVRARIDGEVYDLSEEIALEKNNKHNIEIVIDRLVVREGIEKRLTDSIETSLKIAEGLCYVEVMGERKAHEDLYDEESDSSKKQLSNLMVFSENFACPDCNISIGEVQPRSFSFNNPFGACPVCSGLGYKMDFDVKLMIPNENLSLNEGAISVMGWLNSKDKGSFSHSVLEGLSKKYNFSLDTPFKDLPEDIKHKIIHGTNGEEFDVVYEGKYGKSKYRFEFEGLIKNVQKRYRETPSQNQKAEYESYMRITPCEECGGQRLKKESLAVTIGDKNIHEATNMPIRKIKKFLANLELSPVKQTIAEEILKEINARLAFMIDVGLDYLTLTRHTATLSGGEAQRIRLATQIGSGLVGVAYILDEPSIGLHQRDNDKLLSALKALKEIGNTLIVVEHDEDTMRAADFIVDVGPLAGVHGGEIVATGTVDDIMKCKRSVTGAYLSGKKVIPVPDERRKPTGFIKIVGARENNLKNIDVEIPTGIFTCVTGVSGSGKSSLINEILHKSLAKTLNRARTVAGDHDRIEGVEVLDKVIDIDQSPIGRTPRSNPATYTGVFDDIRDLFAQTNDAKVKGYDKGKFSFNAKGGRCKACGGDGVKRISMQFLPDVYVPCEVCKGKRYMSETLEVKFKGKNIADVLDMRVEEALEFFDAIPKIKSKLQTIYDVGLGYIKLGQSSTELSGGEAQRVKLAYELQSKIKDKTLYVMDEPTTGLHTDDIKKLMNVINRIADTGATVIIIEHNLDVIKLADYIVDMGPDGGEKGGTVLATGRPEDIAKCEESYTGQYLKKILNL